MEGFSTPPNKLLVLILLKSVDCCVNDSFARLEDVTGGKVLWLFVVIGDIVLAKGLVVEDNNDGIVSSDPLVSVASTIDEVSEGVVDELTAPTDDVIIVLKEVSPCVVDEFPLQIELFEYPEPLEMSFKTTGLS